MTDTGHKPLRMTTALAAFEAWAEAVIPMLESAGEKEAAAFGNDRIEQSENARTTVRRLDNERGPNLRGSGYCPGCRWAIDLHPTDADGVDVSRCPTVVEQEQIEFMLDSHKRELLALATRFPSR
jgi:hypothetical protein